MLKHHIWKQTISHGHSRAATVPIGTLLFIVPSNARCCVHASGFQPYSPNLPSCFHAEPGSDLQTTTDSIRNSFKATSPSLDQPLGASSSFILVSSEMSNLVDSPHLYASPQVSSDTSPISGRPQSSFKPKHLKPKQPQHLAGHGPAGLQVYSICCWQRLCRSKHVFIAQSGDNSCCKEARGSLH